MKRHFLFWAPASFGNSSLSREADVVRRALIKPSRETIPQRRMAGPGGAHTWQLPWFSSTGEGRGGQQASLEHLLGTFTSRILTTPLYDRCE